MHICGRITPPVEWVLIIALQVIGGINIKSEYLFFFFSAANCAQVFFNALYTVCH